jgi:hypothetical protein
VTDLDLRRALDAATHHLPSPDLAERALAGARRRRRRRTAAGAVAVVLLATGAVTWELQRPAQRADVVQTPTPVPSPDADVTDPSELPTPPPIDPDVVQEVWDPATAPGLPWADLGLPEALEPPTGVPGLTGIPSARAAVMRRDLVHVLAVDGGWRVTKLPEEWDPAAAYHLALSRDGTIVSVTGTTGLLSLDVRSGHWRRAAYPDGFPQRAEYGVDITAQVGELAWLEAGDRRWQLDVQTGSADEVTVPRHLHDVALAPHGLVVGVGSPERPHLVRTVELVAPGASTPFVFRADSLHSLTGLASDGESLAAMRGVPVSGPDLDDTFRNGLIALDLDDLSTRAYLPVEDPDWAYSDGQLLQPVAWLDADTVLVSVGQQSGPGAGDRTLFTWDVRSGDLRRVTTLPAALPYDVALDVLGE